MKAYSHTNEKLLYNNTETIQGVGVSYQESFDTLRELLQEIFRLFTKEKVSGIGVLSVFTVMINSGLKMIL